LKGNRSDGLETLEWLKQISEGLAEKLAGFVVDKVFKGKQLERPIKFTIRRNSLRVKGEIFLTTKYRTNKRKIAISKESNNIATTSSKRTKRCFQGKLIDRMFPGKEMRTTTKTSKMIAKEDKMPNQNHGNPIYNRTRKIILSKYKWMQITGMKRDYQDELKGRITSMKKFKYNTPGKLETTGPRVPIFQHIDQKEAQIRPIRHGERQCIDHTEYKIRNQARIRVAKRKRRTQPQEKNPGVEPSPENTRVRGPHWKNKDKRKMFFMSKNNLGTKTNKCTIMTLNVRGLIARKEELIQFIQINSIDIACIQETWMTPKTKKPKCNGYNLLHTEPSIVKGSGVAIFMNKNIIIHNIIVYNLKRDWNILRLTLNLLTENP
jgi:hypothetical protein